MTAIAVLSERLGAQASGTKSRVNDGALVADHHALAPLARDTNLLPLAVGPDATDLHIDRRILSHAGALRPNGAHVGLGFAFQLHRHDRPIVGLHGEPVYQVGANA